MLAAVFTPEQMHRISSYDIRKNIFFGPLLSMPFSVPSHFALLFSIISGYFNFFVI